MNKLKTCLWFDGQAEDAARFYTSVFENSKILNIQRYPKAGSEIHGNSEGSVMLVEFEINDQTFIALNGGPHFKINEAVSFVVSCADQKELDEVWSKLSHHPDSEQCGWLKDRFGVSWQIVPETLAELMEESDRAERVMAALLKMKKLDIQTLENA